MTALTSYFVNVNFVCNERCVFCAAGLADGAMTVTDRRGGVTLDDVKAWTSTDPPGPQDEVAIAGGEPTLHAELLPIVRHLAGGGAAVTLFTNGLKLADRSFARAVLAAGVTRVEIALFGATAASHEAVTRRPSFDRTLRALEVLGGLHDEATFTLEVRLLVARHCYRENPDIVRLVAARLPGVDAISLNRLILSRDAVDAGAAVSWAQARAAVNETARLIREHGFEFRYEAVPLCVYAGDNAAFVAAAVARRRSLGPAAKPALRYLDPRSAAGQIVGELRDPLGLPRACRVCDLLPHCGRVEQWYLDLFGTDGIQPCRVEAG